MQNSTERITHSSTTTANQFDIDGNTYICKKCNFTFTNKDTALRHYRAQHYSLHHGRHTESQRAWQSLFNAEGACSLCDFRPTQPVPQDKNTFDIILRDHLDTQHPGKRREVIYAAFDREVEADNTAIAQLNRVAALAPKAYACTNCNLSFSTAQERLQHQNHKHPIPILQASLTCPECGKVFNTIRERRTHRHTFPCRHCAGQFSTDAGLKSHLLQCLRRPRDQFPCPLCGEFFDAERLLKAHLAMKHQPTQRGKSSKQVEIVRENGRKRLKLEEEESQCTSVSPKVNRANESTACSWDCVEPKKDVADASNLNALISVAIVKDEVEDNEIESSFQIESETKPETFSPLFGNASIDLKHEVGTGDGDLSEMTVSVTICKEESDDLRSI